MAEDHEKTDALARLSVAGVGAGDQAWFNSIGWNPASAGPIGNSAQADDYARREAVLNASVAHLSFAERGTSLEGKLAAEIGARLADWRERGDDEEDK